MPSDRDQSDRDGRRCRMAVTAIAVLAAAVLAIVMVRGYLLSAGPSLLAAAAGGMAVYLGLIALACRPVPERASRAVLPSDASGRMATGAGAPAVQPARAAAANPVAVPDPAPATAPRAATEPAAPIMPATVAAVKVEPMPEAAAPPPPLPLPEAAAPPPPPLPPPVAAGSRPMDKALGMAVAASRAAPGDRRPAPADARRARAPRVSAKSEGAARGAAKAAKTAAALQGPVKGSATIAPARKAPSAPAGRVGKPEAAAKPVGGGIDAAIARSHHASPVMTGNVVRLARPRGGQADDLKLIRGIGPKLEALLNSAGIWHFDQIATWKARDIAEIDAAMTGFHGRITRDGWVKQARAFVAGAVPAGKPRARRDRKDEG